MKSKKIFSIILVAALLIATLVGCDIAVPESDTITPAPESGTSTPDSGNAGGLKDGLYYASDDSFSNDWKYNVAIEIKDGKVVDAEWNGLNIAGGKDKYTLAEDGEYGMIKASTLNAGWHEQASRVADFLIENGGQTKVEYSNEAGNTDAISGVTIKVKDFFELTQKALLAGPVAKGDFKDGYYYKKAEGSGSDEIPFAQLVVLNGTIVDANINVLMKNLEGKDSNKKTVSISGDYGMDLIAKIHMHEQLTNIGDFLVDKQSTDVNYIDARKTDSITGATIGVKEFFVLVDEALEGNPDYPIFK